MNKKLIAIKKINSQLFCEDFEESNLLCMVDFVNLTTCSKEFLKLIKED